MQENVMKAPDLTGDDLVRVLATLASPHRMRVLTALSAGPTYVSQLARDLGISRALLQVHLKRLEAVGLVTARIEVSEDGKAMKFYEVSPFELHLTPQTLTTAVETLAETSERGEAAKKEL
jgi:predicted transcriptional regulator